jgi:O-acetyl-ADP-ribose deacetylase (regulator of RNase III)
MNAENRINFIYGNITKIKVDAIVNAANPGLLGGGGVDGAIHKAAGPQLLDQCKKLNGCLSGEAKITDGFNLPAKYIIHTVGPVWSGGNNKEEQILASCYRNSLNLAEKHGIKTIAFPAISTGIYGFPFESACIIALKTILQFLNFNKNPHTVTLVCFSENDYKTYHKILNETVQKNSINE